MTDIDLNHLEQLMKGESDKTWAVKFNRDGDPFVVEAKRGWFDVVAQVSTVPDDYGKARAELIVALRNGAPALFAELRQLRADAQIVATLRREVKQRKIQGMQTPRWVEMALEGHDLR